ncbi:MAG: HAMP domain-containing sensor histidine kinase [Bacteroidota bacterium]|nr:HAMP domain-containing sensor histidine kinase [Bacteroidota bacterium]
MKPGITIFIASLALFGLIAIQYYLVSDLYHLKRNKFDTEYGTAIGDGLEALQLRYNTNGFDTVFYLMDILAYEKIEDYEFAFNDSVVYELNGFVKESFKSYLETFERVSPFLLVYLEEVHLDTDFHIGFFFREIQLLDQDREYLVFTDGEIAGTGNETSFGNTEAIHANNFRIEGNYFRVEFDYYIDFTHKTRIIYREMAGAFILSLISILIAGFVFMITIRNMLKQIRLSAMKTDFINNMAHELKTPLTTISVASSTLVNTDKNPDKEKIVSLSEMIRQQNKQLGKLIDQILDINLWEKDQITLKLAEVEMKPLIKSRLDAFRLEHSDEAFTLRDHINLDGIKMLIDEFQLTIALHNLLSNALKYGGDPAEIELESGIETDHIFVKLKDNGRGISYDEQSLVFSKFYRGKDVANRKGLGLGLFYVREIVELHGGKVEVFSKLGQGSSFVIRLPLANNNKL